jgi:transposase
MTRTRHSIEFREQALSKARQRGARSVQNVANDLNMSAGTLRKWLEQSNQKGGASVPESLASNSARLRNCNSVWR